MDIKLKLHIKTPVGTARKIKVRDDGELVFVAPRKTESRDVYGHRNYERVDEEFSLDACEIWIVEED